MSAGIDYGRGQANIDRAIGIRYGVISQHSVMPEALDDVEYDYGPPLCPKCGNEAIVIPSHTESSDPPGQWVSVVQDVPEHMTDWDISGCPDYACKSCQYLFDSSEAFGDESYGWTYAAEGYSLQDCLDSDIFVLASPFYTYAPFCSPCVPGAGNLDSAARQDQTGEPTDVGVKTYCLGHDWFEDGTAPYRVFHVSDDTEVFANV